RLALKNPDRFEPDYAASLGSYSVHLSNVGKDEEALEYTREALGIHKRLALKNPDRFEPDYAASLGSYSVHLSNVGKDEEALEYTREALEIRKRLAQKNPDRFEPDYALSLSNYASDLSNTGKDEEALEHAREALEIHKRLAQKNPDRFAADLFGSACFAHFLVWLCDQGEDSDNADLKELIPFIPSHQRALMLLYSAFVEGCRAANQDARNEAFRKVLLHWADLSLASKNKAEPYWLCAAAWCAQFGPAKLMETDWEASWRQFVKQRNGWIPAWML